MDFPSSPAGVADAASASDIPQEVRDWHERHPEVPLVESDYSNGNDYQEYRSHSKVVPWDENLMSQYETDGSLISPVWGPRGPDGKTRMEALEDYVTPHLDKLNARDRQLVEWLFWEGRTQKEYADQRGISQQAVSKAAKAALRRLRNIIESE